MGFDWQGYFWLARWLSYQTRGWYSDETLVRNVISRVYYSALHALNEFYYEVLHKYPKKTEEETTHKALIENVLEDFVKYFSGDAEVEEDLRDVTDTLDDFRDLRNKADYDPYPIMPMDEDRRDEAFEYALVVTQGISAFRRKYI